MSASNLHQIGSGIIVKSVTVKHKVITNKVSSDQLNSVWKRNVYNENGCLSTVTWPGDRNRKVTTNRTFEGIRCRKKNNWWKLQLHTLLTALITAIRLLKGYTGELVISLHIYTYKVRFCSMWHSRCFKWFYTHRWAVVFAYCTPRWMLTHYKQNSWVSPTRNIFKAQKYEKQQQKCKNKESHGCTSSFLQTTHAQRCRWEGHNRWHTVQQHLQTSTNTTTQDIETPAFFIWVKFLTVVTV